MTSGCRLRDEPREGNGPTFPRSRRKQALDRSLDMATSQAATQIGQTTLRNVLGQSELDELLAERKKINHDLQVIIDEQTEGGGESHGSRDQGCGVARHAASWQSMNHSTGLVSASQ